MKYYSLGDIRNFKCIGSDCPNHCCKGWTISIDPYTEQYYRSVDGEFGKKLQENILSSNNKAEFKLDNYGRCNFLTSENLCEIYINLGPDKMCDTCRIYPRGATLITPNISIKFLTLSCPEVARIWLNQSTLPSLNIPKNNEFQENEFIQSSINKVTDGFITSLKILQDRTINLADRIQLVIYFNSLYEEYLKGNKSTTELFNLFKNTENLNYINDNISPIKADSIKMHKWILEICKFYLTSKNTPCKELMIPIVETIQQYALSDYPNLSNMISQIYQETDSKHFELLFTHILFQNYFESIHYFDFTSCLQPVLFLYYFQICLMAYTRKNSCSQLSLDDFIMIYSLISRSLEHSKSKKKEFIELSTNIIGNEMSDLLSITF